MSLVKAVEHKYEFELDVISGEDASIDADFYSFDNVVTMGNTLEELEKNAVIFTVDQDGGEGPEWYLDSLGNPLYTAVIKAIRAQFNKERSKWGD